MKMEASLLVQSACAYLGSFLFLTFLGSKNVGSLLAAILFALGFTCSLYFDSWYPLFASFFGERILRLLGFDTFIG